jgi:DNA-binding LacI/PurR family transcriptional regulator
LGLVGYDDIDTVRHLQIPITSVAYPKLEIGRSAGRSPVFGITEGVFGPRKRFEPPLLVRQSCGVRREKKPQLQGS